MSAELSFYSGVVFTKDGQTTAFGSLSTPVKTVTLTGDVNRRNGGALAASTEVTLWMYSSSQPDFSALAIQSDGILDVEIKADKPTSSSDSTALGTYVNYQTVQIESHGWFVLTGDQARVSVSATAKSSSSLSSSTQGKVYEVKLRNNGTSTVNWEAVVFN